MNAPLLDVRGLKKHFGAKAMPVRAVDGVSFTIGTGETLGLVGESGSGKSTIGRTILKLIEPTAGEVYYKGEDLAGLSQRRMRPYRRHMQVIFQDPYASLNPRMRVIDIVGEALDVHRLADGAKRRERVAELLDLVGLSAEHMRRFPYEFSGGQRQRIGIARALAVEPDFIIADEPVSALDVSVQAQVVNLLRDLQKRLGLTMLFISHDLDVVDYLCGRIAVLYLGRIMEIAPRHTLREAPRHPYTVALQAAAPKIGERRQGQRPPLRGDIPSPINPPSGCVFRTRCPHALEMCAQMIPPLVEVAPQHWKACLRDDVP